MKRAFLLCMMLAAAPLSGFAQGTAPAPLTGKLLITGSSIMAPLVEELGKRFRTRHPGVAITVESGGSGRGVADALEGKADIGMVSRELNPKEKTLFAIPIAREDLAKLFKPFVQLDAGLARRHGGVGLGLALTRRLAELHGGTIEVASEPGTGSTFTLRFPIQEHS